MSCACGGLRDVYQGKVPVFGNIRAEDGEFVARPLPYLKQGASAKFWHAANTETTRPTAINRIRNRTDVVHLRPSYSSRNAVLNQLSEYP